MYRLQLLSDRFREVWQRLGCTPAESLALAILASGALGLLGLVWWQQRPVPAEVAVQVPDGLMISEPVPTPGYSGDPPDAVRAPVTAETPGTIQVHVAGRVERPGVYELQASARVVDAVAAAGGPSAEADVEAINLAQPLSDGMQVRVPAPGETPLPAAQGAVTGAGQPGGGADAVVDLNTADQAALETLPGIGPVTAQRILEHRKNVGGFASVEQLLEIRGIGETTLADLRDKVTAR